MDLTLLDRKPSLNRNAMEIAEEKGLRFRWIEISR